MIKFFYKMFNNDKLDDAARLLTVYRDRVKQLEGEVKEYKRYKLKYEVARLSVENHKDLELLEDKAKLHSASFFARHGHFGAMQAVGYGLMGPTELDIRYENLMNRLGA